MDVFQTPFSPEPSLEESEEQFEVFCRKRGMYLFFFFFSPMSFISLLCFLHTPTPVPRNFEASSCVSQCKAKKQFLNLVVHLIYWQVLNVDVQSKTGSSTLMLAAY